VIDGTVLVAIGASAGGVEALRALMAKLPGDLQASVLIVLHIPASSESVLPAILDRAGKLHVERAESGMEIRPGRVLVGPADHHMTVSETHVRLDQGPRVNGHRPAIDPLFASCASWYGPYAMGIVLSGMLDDGVAGLLRLSQVGAVTVAQDPNEAAYPALPRAAIERGGAQKVLVLDDIANLIAMSSNSDAMALREVVAMQGRAQGAADRHLSPFTCPDCRGTLWEITDAAGTQFCCRAGHAFSVDSLVQVSSEALDDALWAGYRSLLEQADLCRRMSRRTESVGSLRTAERYDKLARDAERRAWVLHEALVAHGDSSEVDAERGRAG
jgi:two-component system chemotaxis response regulator CheB